MERVKVAVTGFENGHSYCLHAGLLAEPDVEVVAIAFAPRQRIISEERMGKHCFENMDIYYDTEEMLNAHPEIEVCVCGGNNATHIADFRLCAQRGIHIISMKVPTMDMDEYDEMIALAKKHNILVYIELEVRWKAAIERIRRIIQEGRLGEIQSFTAYNYSHHPVWWNSWIDTPEQSYGKRIPLTPGNRRFRGGALTDHPHIFDIARYLIGSDFDTMYATVAPNMRAHVETEDLVYVIGKMQNGVIVSLDPSFANREPEQPIHRRTLSLYPRPVQVELQVNGTRGTLYADPFCSDYVETMCPGTLKYEVEGIDLEIDDQRRLFIRNMISDIRKGTRQQDVTLESHKKTIQAINAAYDSIYLGKPVKVKY